MKRPIFPARIVLSKNMIRQGYEAPRKTFANADEAYLWGMQKWGSGTYEGVIPAKQILREKTILYDGWGVKEMKPKR